MGMQVTTKKRALFRNDSSKAGQTIVEATIALASILLTLAAIAVAISTSLNNSQFIKQQSQASKFAQDGMEQLRFERNISPSVFFAREGIYCMNEDNSMTPGSCSAANIQSTFKREAEFVPPSSVECGDTTKVVVSVYWISSKCSSSDTFCHKSQLVSCFADQTGSAGSL